MTAKYFKSIIIPKHCFEFVKRLPKRARRMYMSIKNVVVAGGGVLGSQIAFQTAYRGFNVTLWLRSAESIERTKPKIERLRGIYLTELEAAKAKAGVKGAMVSRGLIPDIENATAESIKNKVEEAYKNLKYETEV